MFRSDVRLGTSLIHHWSPFVKPASVDSGPWRIQDYECVCYAMEDSIQEAATNSRLCC